MSNGKGSRPRPKAISEAEWARRHVLTFPPTDWKLVPDGEMPDEGHRDPTLEYRWFHELLYARPRRDVIE